MDTINNPDAITLPCGDVVTLIDPEDVRERDRRKIEGAYATISEGTYKELVEAAEQDREVELRKVSPEDLEFLNTVNDQLIVALIDTWVTADGTPVPRTDESLQNLRAKDFKALEAFAKPRMEQMNLDFSPTPAHEGETPTVPASA